MKTKIMLGILVATVGTAFGLARLDGGPIPVCRPGVPCTIDGKTLDGPIPICRPGFPCKVNK